MKRTFINVDLIKEPTFEGDLGLLDDNASNIGSVTKKLKKIFTYDIDTPSLTALTSITFGTTPTATTLTRTVPAADITYTLPDTGTSSDILVNRGTEQIVYGKFEFDNWITSKSRFATNSANTVALNNEAGSNGVIVGNSTGLGLSQIYNCIIRTMNSSLLPAHAAGAVYLLGDQTSPVCGRTVFGDGTGWRYYFSNRVGSVTTDVFSIIDSGDVESLKTNATFWFDNITSHTTDSDLQLSGNGTGVVKILDSIKVPTISGTAANWDHYEINYTHSTTISGLWGLTLLPITFTLSKNGNFVNLRWTGIIGAVVSTPDTNALTSDALPARFRHPSYERQKILGNDGTYYGLLIEIYSTGIIRFYREDNTNFTTAFTIEPGSVTYCTTN